MTCICTYSVHAPSENSKSSDDGFSVGGDPDDTSSSVSDVLGSNPSEGRGNGDGQEEVHEPYPTMSDNDAGVSQVCVYMCVFMCV